MSLMLRMDLLMERTQTQSHSGAQDVPSITLVRFTDRKLHKASSLPHISFQIESETESERDRERVRERAQIPTSQWVVNVPGCALLSWNLVEHAVEKVLSGLRLAIVAGQDFLAHRVVVALLEVH